MPTTVVNVRGRRAELLADPMFLYVGRAVPRAGWAASPWANPFKVGMTFERAFELVAEGTGYTGKPRVIEDAAHAVRFFNLYANTLAWDKHAPPILRGKRLGCWCCNWNPGDPVIVPCHAIALAQLADGGGYR